MCLTKISYYAVFNTEVKNLNIENRKGKKTRKKGINKATQKTEIELENSRKLFYSQIETLNDRGCPNQIINMLKSESHLVFHTSEILSNKGNIAFIPVIPLSYRSHYDLIAMVNEKQGKSYLDDRVAIRDRFYTPKKPYYIFDVDNGQYNVYNMKKTIKIFKKQSRLPLTLAEILSLATHTNVLEHHFLNAAGSRYGMSNMPDIYLDIDSFPVLDHHNPHISDVRWRTPSCGIRDI